MSFTSKDGNEKQVDPMSGVVPIIKEKEQGILQTIGTGFYLTRYGLVVTAGHVIKDLAIKDNSGLTVCFVCHPLDPNNVNLRKIITATYMKDYDVGILQVDNYCKKVPNNPLQNLKVRISPTIPMKGDKVVTYAFPENEVMYFKDNSTKRIIKGDFYEGNFLRYVEKSENPNIPYPHFETSIKLKSGASGGPVFCNGNVIGVNCRSMEFLAENNSEKEYLSYIVPITVILPMKIKLLQLPKISWEFNQLTEEQRNAELSVEQLINAKHIEYVI